jgi:protein-S-isoprenylcysteine O-methyltransferase Ste14
VEAGKEKVDIYMAAHKNTLCVSDTILFIVLAFAFALEVFAPTTLLIPIAISTTLGVVLIVCAWALIFIAKYQFRKTNQKTGPRHETSTLMMSGIFKYTRNPIYLGVALLAPALGLLVDSVWAVIAIVPLGVFLQRFLIIPEEKYLSEKFGVAFSDYCNRTRRWL